MAVLSARDIIGLLGLAPLEREGGYFVETYRGPRLSGTTRAASTAIYYLLTPEGFSALHRLPSDEIYHFYFGDPVELLQLRPDGTGTLCRLGPGLASGERPQWLVPAGVWQGSRLAAGGRAGFALLGTTVAPGFQFEDYAPGDGAALALLYPAFARMIASLAR